MDWITIVFGITTFICAVILVGKMWSEFSSISNNESVFLHECDVAEHVAIREKSRQKPLELVRSPHFTDADVADFRDELRKITPQKVYSIPYYGGSGSLVDLSSSVVQVSQLQEIERGFCNYCGSAFRPDEYECCKCGAPKERK